MSKPVEKQKVIELRRAGLSYREIRRQVPVARATLSLSLRSVGRRTILSRIEGTLAKAIMVLSK